MHRYDISINLVNYVIQSRNIFTVVVLLINFTLISHAQKRDDVFSFWSLRSFNGKISLGGEQSTLRTSLRNNFQEKLKSTVFLGDIIFRTQSSFLHPKFMLVDIDGEFNPTTRKDLYIVMPDQGDVSTAEKIGSRIMLFNQLPVSISGFGNYTHVFLNRENLTDVESFQKALGGIISWRNAFAPLSASYRYDDYLQNELLTKRTYHDRQNILTADVHTSFFKMDRQNLEFSYDRHERKYFESGSYKNNITRINLESMNPFDSTGQGLSNTTITYQSERLLQNYDRFEGNERINYNLPYNFSAAANYRFFYQKQEPYQWKLHNVNVEVQHQLFESVKTQIDFEFIKQYYTQFEETIKAGTFGLQYQKNIPFGMIQIQYQYRKRFEKRQSITTYGNILNESHVLEDTKIVLLDHPNVLVESIEVIDSDIVIRYVKNLDYILIPHGESVEIRRLPGGQISNGTRIYVNYRVDQNPSYDFSSIGNMVRTNLLLFNNVIDLYYQYSDQTFTNSKEISGKRFDVFYQRIAGFRVLLPYLSLGVELDDKASTIIPYYSRRIYSMFSPTLFTDLNISLVGNYYDIYLRNEDVRQKFYDVSGKIQYNFWNNAFIFLEGFYRKQIGNQMNLDLSRVKGEFSVPFRLVRFFIGAEAYQQKYIDQMQKYTRVYVKIEREF